MKRVLPKLVIKYKTFSPTKLKEKLLLEYNIERSPDAFTKFFKRHPELERELRKQIQEEDATHETIRYDFDYWIDEDLRSQIPIIQNWIDTMIGRKVSTKVIRREVGRLRQICLGTKARGKRVNGKFETNIRIVDWKIHPLALTQERGLKYIAELVRQGYDDFPFRLTIRNFLKFGKGELPTKIPAYKPQAKYAHINASKDKCNQILNWIREQDYLTYAYCLFLKKTGTRAEATHTAKFSARIKEEQNITIWDKGKRGEKYRWDKHIDDELLHALKPLLEERKLFQDVDMNKAMELCRDAYEKFIPETAEEFSVRPLHFWRHIFAQHMLRATKWNYSMVAELGGWKSEQTLKDHYGKPPKELIKKWGMEYIPTI